MRSTFMGFETAKKAIFVNQKALDIVGNNYANIETPGYTRQRVDRAQVSSNTGSSRIASSRIDTAGQGVDALGVSQTRDSFLDKRFREEYSKASYHGQSASMLQDIQSALGDGQDITDEAGLYGAIKEIYKSLNDFVSEPTMSTQANLVMSAFKNISQVLNQLDTNLTKAATQQTEDLKSGIIRVNEISSQIAHLNKMIGDDASVLANPDNEYFRPNELLDQRNLLLDELSNFGDINVTQLANGKINVEMGGHQIVNENKFDTLNVYTNTDKTVAVQWRSSGESASFKNGALIASIHHLNGRGTNIQSPNEEPFQGIPYYRDQLDTFAASLASLTNNTVPELDETTGKPLVVDGKTVYKTFLSSGKSGSPVVSAGNISISDEWKENGAEYFIFDKNQNIEDYAQQLATGLTEKEFTFDSYGEKYTGTFADFEVNLLGKLGADIQFHQGRQSSYGKAADDFLDRRDEISGVSEDEETTDMMRFQKSYEAASRFMTVLDDLLDVIVNRMGRAGL